MSRFDPNSVTFAEGEVRVERALKRARVNINRGIITSKDRAAVKLTKTLAIKNVPKGFTKWQLPFVLDRSQAYVTVGKPNAVVGKHSHDEGAGVRFIMQGSIVYKNRELGPGDWMYIPAGAKYDFRVGSDGVTMCYCYCCSCAGQVDIRDFLSDPAPLRS
jgi:hypothetical protein